MIAGYILAESMPPGARLQGLPLTLTKIERYAVRDAAPGQPSVWTTIEFEFPEGEAERVANALSEVVAEQGGWYTNFDVGDETFVIFANRIFRYRRGDEAARAEVAAYGRSVGVPESQLDWDA
jgi:hypothetical protein